MPTARSASPVTTARWPAYYPPRLRALSDPRPHPHPASRPPSTRYTAAAPPRTLQDDLDDLDNDEDTHYNHVYDLRQYGHAWLIPLGKQRTLDEEVDSQCPSSPNHEPMDGDLSFSPPIAGAATAAAAANHHLARPRHPPRPEHDPAMAARGRRPRLDDAELEDGPVVDLDAEIEDADATRNSGDGDDDDDDDEDDRPHSSGTRTPARQRLPPRQGGGRAGQHHHDDDDDNDDEDGDDDDASMDM